MFSSGLLGTVEMWEDWRESSRGLLGFGNVECSKSIHWFPKMHFENDHFCTFRSITAVLLTAMELLGSLLFTDG